MLRTYKVFPKILVEGKNEWSESSREVLPGPEAASKGWNMDPVHACWKVKRMADVDLGQFH